MTHLNVSKLRVRLMPNITARGPIVPRCYTLTHSDTSGDLYLTIGTTYNKGQTAGWYTRIMRDEVLAEWRQEEPGSVLYVFCHVSGGMVFGNASWRYAIFRRELPLVLEVFRYGDQRLYEAHPELDNAPIQILFNSHLKKYQLVQHWGVPADYKL